MDKAKKLKRNDMRVTYSGTYGMGFSSKVIRSVKCAAVRTQQRHGAVVSVPGCFCVCRDLSIQTEIQFYYSSFRHTRFLYSKHIEFHVTVSVSVLCYYGDHQCIVVAFGVYFIYIFFVAVIK